VMRSVLLPSRRLKEAAVDSFFGPLWPFAPSSFQFAAVQESAFGTKRTNGAVCCLSAFGGKADIRCPPALIASDAIDPKRTLRSPGFSRRDHRCLRLMWPSPLPKPRHVTPGFLVDALGPVVAQYLQRRLGPSRTGQVAARVIWHHRAKRESQVSVSPHGREAAHSRLRAA